MEKVVDIKNKFYNKIIVWTVDNKLRLDKHVENIYQRLGEINYVAILADYVDQIKG